MKQEMNGKIKHAFCPKCKSDNMYYEDLVIKEDKLYYYFECNDCGQTGKEWYKIAFLAVTFDGE